MSQPTTTTPSLGERLRERIRREGPIPFVEYMRAALYEPAGGYYGAGRARLGRAGDFFTSVSVGPLFGRLLARQFIEMWEHLGRPGKMALIEQGAHEGTLAKDVLTGLREFEPACAEAVELWIDEPGEWWAERQRETLADFSRVSWVASARALSVEHAVFYSNELIDAFPVHRVVWDGAAWKEQYVSLQADRFSFENGPLSDAGLVEAVARIPTPLPAGYTTEVNLGAAAWLREAAGALARGWVLTIDYGFTRDEYHRPERSEGTLTGYSRHQRIDDVFQTPGEIDLTAHVDFTTLLETAPECGLNLAGFTDQQRFIAGLGRLHFQDTATVSPERAREQRAFMTLLHPELMGAAFKAICFWKGVGAPPLSGFTFGA